MQSQLINTNIYKKLYAIFGLATLAYIGYAVYYIHDYIQLSYLHIFALVAFLCISRIDTNKQANILMLICSAFFMFCYYKFQATSFLYLSLIILIIECINVYIGKLNINAYLLLLLCSPIFNFITTVIGFPIRLQLSKISGYILSFMVKDIVIIGNMLRIDGNDFAIDQACAGLNMLAAAAIFALLLIEISRKKTRLEISFKWYFFIYIFMFISNIVSNIFRICILTLLTIFPDNSWHEYIGIICFVIYTLIPLYWLIPKIFSKYGVHKVSHSSSSKYKITELLLLVMIMLTGFYTLIYINKSESVQYQTLHFKTLDTYKKSTTEHDIVKYYNNEHLVYVKPMKSFYSSEHNPLFCWTGSGYTMKSFDERMLKNHIIYYGKMVKDNHELFTSWYYTDGKEITNSQWRWRYKSLNENKKYYLINVSAENENSLNAILCELM